MALLENWKLVASDENSLPDFITGTVKSWRGTKKIFMHVNQACPINGPWQYKLGQPNEAFAAQNPEDVNAAHALSNEAKQKRGAMLSLVLGQ